MFIELSLKCPPRGSAGLMALAVDQIKTFDCRHDGTVAIEIHGGKGALAVNNTFANLKDQFRQNRFVTEPLTVTKPQLGNRVIVPQAIHSIEPNEANLRHALIRWRDGGVLSVAEPYRDLAMNLGVFNPTHVPA